MAVWHWTGDDDLVDAGPSSCLPMIHSRHRRHPARSPHSPGKRGQPQARAVMVQGTKAVWNRTESVTSPWLLLCSNGT